MEAFASPDHRATTFADVLVTDFADVLVTDLRFGVPRFLHSDQAPEFMSELMSELCQLLEIHRTRTCPYWPQSERHVERFNPTLSAYRATVNESTGCTPNLLMLGREIIMPVDLMYPPTEHQGYRCHIEYVEWVKCTLQDNFEKARQQLGVAVEQQKHYYDMRTKTQKYKEGDFALRFYPPNLKNKLKSPYLGPYRIMVKLGEVTYQIQQHPTSKPLVVHLDHLKRYHYTELHFEWQTSEGKTPATQAESSNIAAGMGYDADSDVQGNIAHSCTQPQFARRSNRQRRRPIHFDDYYL